MENHEEEVTFTKLFVPLTRKKAIVFTVILGAVVYLQIFFNGFVWDDVSYIIGNPEIEKFNLLTLFGPNMFNSSGYFRPIPAVYFSVLFQIFGKSAWGYHFLQWVMHIGCTVGLYELFRRFFKPGISLFLSWVFLVHPINVEAVAYIGASQSQLYLLFGGAAVYLSLKKDLSARRIWAIHWWLLLAFLTKEVGVLFLGLVYFYRWLQGLKIPKLQWGLTGLTVGIYLALRMTVLSGVLQKMHLIPISEIPLTARLMHIPAVFFYYLKTWFFPQVLVIDQIWTISQITLTNFYLPLLADGIFLGLIVWGLNYFHRHDMPKFRLMAFFAGWYLASVAMLMQVFPLDMTVADRWFYLPGVGMLGMLGVGLAEAGRRIKGLNKTAAAAAGGIVLILLAARTMGRTADWKDGLTLYGRDAGYYANYDLENYLGYELAQAGKQAEALPHFVRAAELLPHDTNLYNIGSIFEHLGDYPKALQYYGQALELNRGYMPHPEVRRLAYTGRLRLLLRTGTPEQTNPEMQKAVAEFPQEGTFWAFLAINEYALKQQQPALAAAEKAKQFLPNAYTTKLYELIKNHREIDLSFD
jgi:hypothetical protein